MPTLATRRANPLPKLATFTLALTLLSFAASDASAGWRERCRAYYANFYGQDFYDGQNPGLLAHPGPKHQYNGAYYGPPQMYSRQYVEQYGTRTDPPFRPLHSYGGNGHGGNCPQN